MRYLADLGTFTGNLVLCIYLCASHVCAEDASSRVEFFEKHIRPVLATHCFECHGTDKQESDLRLDHSSFLFTDGNFGAVVVPGQPEQSQLFLSISHKNDDLRMPHERSKLPTHVIANFKSWIQAGAVWPEERVPESASGQFDIEARKQRLPWIWRRPESQRIPEVRRSDWARNDIDRFILNKLEQARLEPAQDASPEIWLRRVHFALVGLPPSIDDLERFLGNPSEDSRERIVDDLLNSPHFGERWARHWMDLVRYAESRGHEGDYAIANAWHYRDYLIRAFNADVPYDQFVREHLAGDLLTEPRLHPGSGANESVLATAWPYFGEEVHSPVDIRQDECDRLDNKIDVLSKTFLGLTVACARCHDHKFDAISQEDYYALAGFILSSSYRQMRFESDAQNREVANQFDRDQRRTHEALGSLLSSSIQNLDQVSTFIRQGKAKSPSLPAIASADARVIADFSDPDVAWMTNGYAFGLRPKLPGNLKLDDQGLLRIETLGCATHVRMWDVLSTMEGNQKDPGNHGGSDRAGRMLRTPTHTLQSGRLQYLFQGEARVYASVDSHLMLAGPLHGKLTKTIKAEKPTWIVHDLRDYVRHRVHIEFGAIPGKRCDVYRVVEYPGDLSDFPASEQVDPDAFSTLVDRAFVCLENGDITRQPDHIQLATAIDWVLSQPDLFPVASSAKQAIEQVSAELRRRQTELASQIVTSSKTAVAMIDGSGVNENILLRGKPGRPGNIAIRRLPHAFTQGGKLSDTGSGRLQLADAIVDPDNPLASRVITNRIWHHLFGKGIVATVDNFGWLGSRPTHPQLLDHLAHTFIYEDDWSTKRMLKRIVLSSTYRMSSRPSNPRAEELDPDNSWLHRMPVLRLEAEIIRDNVLAVSGRLDHQIHGTPVPVHLTEFVVGRGRPSESGPLDGNGRRSIYTSVRRNFLPTVMLTFDMPIPFSTVGRRNVTNVPAQSLALANDAFIYQQAAIWAQRLLRETEDVSQGIVQAYREAFAREPSADELSICLKNLRSLADLHATSIRDQRVWKDFCHTLFRVNEFIFIR